LDLLHKSGILKYLHNANKIFFEEHKSVLMFYPPSKVGCLVPTFFEIFNKLKNITKTCKHVVYLYVVYESQEPSRLKDEG